MSAPESPVLIIGAGISGLLLAQCLRRLSIPFLVFERDTDLETRGVGWGLTLHWSLAALAQLLPADLHDRLPEAYVDREAVERGEASRFPFYHLGTGELLFATPKAPHSQRVRVTRGRFRELLAEGIEIQWGKAFKSYTSTPEAVTATFDDGTTYSGSLIVACDGNHSRVRRALFPRLELNKLPVRAMGLRADYTPEEIQQIRAMDAFFLQGSSENDVFLYFSVLDAPQKDKGIDTQDGSTGGTNGHHPDKYSCQLVVSWPVRPGILGRDEPVEYPATNDGRVGLLGEFAASWAEPFKSMVLSLPTDTAVKTLDLHDLVPGHGQRGHGRVVLAGDALHPMTMYRGEGANHAICDIEDLVTHVAPLLPTTTAPNAPPASFDDLRAALDRYEDEVVERSRRGVYASRRACLDAHDWGLIKGDSPLLTRREKFTPVLNLC